MGAVNRAKNNHTMDKRSLCCLIICVNLCFVIWLVSVQQLEATDDGGASSSASSALIASTQLQQQQQEAQSSANGSSKPNQIHDPSRTQQLSSNLSSYYYYSPSLVSLDKAATPAPMPTIASRLSLPSSPSTSSSSSSSADDSQLIDLHNFAYTMGQPSCEAHIQALILVHTAPRNAEKRTLIRQTWGSRPMTNANSPLRVVFLLGAVNQTEHQLQHSLSLENVRHGDMVQGNFRDAYRNMTYKHVMALKWFNSNCPNAQLLIKVDDDVYVNTPQLIKLLRDSPTNSNLTMSSSTPATPSLRSLLQQRHELLFCRPVLATRVKRSYRSKWRVSFREFPAHYYPPYCPGFAIVYSSDVVQRLYQAAQHAGYFWVDDVHITGVLAQQTNTTITNLQPYVLYRLECERLLSGKSDLEQQEFLFTWHSIAPEQISALWQLHVAQNYTLTQRNVQLDTDMDTDSEFS
ncbi:UDP-GalNAc:beta-1,3-N-acetylgalactosaminyltransferase 1 [Drosophila innubila]|uniref:UDP-GalNAc:beta-1, 3-N-acetylgalactosaminyltransferase 1 n=1 Tax=Drosophila innubila TaxID=198719 RepID=UPI00148CB317|nr:UDP-GalNAc:beta-1,3-N-acetylgalactosaminyltransferase 1 [Drosophila innubila]XP_034483439.1 UDP-GalNAc:beta-1,3-N-acetylgalactosaminyltransferase 1 [Drosophila innubila]